MPCAWPWIRTWIWPQNGSRPQVSQTQVELAQGIFKPVFTTNVQQNNQLQPPSSFLDSRGDSERRVLVVGRDVAAAVEMGDELRRVLGHLADQQQLVPEQLRSAASLRVVGEHLAAAAPGLSHRFSAPAPRSQHPKPGGSRYPPPRSTRPDHRARQKRVLEFRGGPRQRRRETHRAGARRRARARQQGQGGRRPVATARSGGGAGRSRRTIRNSSSSRRRRRSRQRIACAC